MENAITPIRQGQRANRTRGSLALPLSRSSSGLDISPARCTTCTITSLTLFFSLPCRLCSWDATAGGGPALPSSAPWRTGRWSTHLTRQAYSANVVPYMLFVRTRRAQELVRVWILIAVMHRYVIGASRKSCNILRTDGDLKEILAVIGTLSHVETKGGQYAQMQPSILGACYSCENRNVRPRSVVNGTNRSPCHRRRVQGKSPWEATRMSRVH